MNNPTLLTTTERRLEVLEHEVENLKEIVANLRIENEDCKEAFETTDDSVNNIRATLANIKVAVDELKGDIS